MTIQELERAIALYGKEIYSFCMHLTGSRQQADELYQDTFLLATERAEQLRAEENPKSYFLSVALRLWKNQKRKFAWRKRIAPTEELFEETAQGEMQSCASALQEYLEQEKKQVVGRAVQSLDEKYRIPILLYYMEELPVSDVAKVMKIPQGTVKSRLSTARKYLEKELEGYFHE
ncbi:MAG: RNA polymerase sigma factor [Lachnospiraceae bacterium]|nr:RNA polymerase sigma factor [Lachnospiraceae bacterium]